MAKHGLSRLPGEVQRREPPPHDRWQDDLLTGSLTLDLIIPEGQFVSPGSGRLGLTRDDAGPVVADRAARAAGGPVIPGSGIKGAVRTIYELLSHSCDPFAWLDRAHREQGGARCNFRSCCDACSLFGVLGRSGRVGFSDATPTEPESVRIEVQRVPRPWLPHGEKTEADFRIYDFGEAKRFDEDRRVWVKQERDLAREVYTGRFTTRMTFWNTSEEELGRLLLSMGIDGAGNYFHLRLGGVKYDGKGAVEVRPRELRLAKPARRSAGSDACLQQCAGWIASAKKSSWAEEFIPKLDELARTLEKKS